MPSDDILSYQDVVDLLAERSITVDRSTVYRWVQKFGPELTKRTEKYLRCASRDWHVDETYIRVSGKWRYLLRAVDAHGQMVDFRLTARRDAKAAKAFLNNAIKRVRLHRPVTIVTAKAPLSGIETIQTIKRGHIHNTQPGVKGEIAFINQLTTRRKRRDCLRSKLVWARGIDRHQILDAIKLDCLTQQSPGPCT
ncbi:MAG: IS6 family transposase [Pseudoruegeria sp.]